MYTDLLNSQKIMKQELEGQTEKMKKISERDKTLKAGQRGGARRRRQEPRKKAPERDAGGRIIRKKPPPLSEDVFGAIPGLGSHKSNESLLRSQSANRNRAPKNNYAKSTNQEDVLVSPSRSRKPPRVQQQRQQLQQQQNPYEQGFDDDLEPPNRDVSRFGFKAPKSNPRPSPHRNKFNDGDNKNTSRNWRDELPSSNNNLDDG